MRTSSNAQVQTSTDAAHIAAAWFARLSSASQATMSPEEWLPAHPPATLAAFAAIALSEGRTLLILVPDDEILPEISNSLDLSIRPLCLVLPAADFAARIALRATLSLLKSRLWRDGEETQSATWIRQRERLAGNAALWQKAQTWTAQNDRSDGPIAITELFPVRILPIAAYRTLQHKAADITLLYRCDAPLELIAPAGRMLRVGERTSTPRYHSLALADENAQLLQEQAQLTRDIADLELELATVQAELAEFTRHYYDRVGQRMAELDALQAQLAEQEAQRAPDNLQARSDARQKKQQAEQSARESQHFTEASKKEAPVFRPSDDIKRRFRQLAQQIHPDRATDEADRAWRTQLMSEANRAYRHGDERALSEIVALWEEGSGGTSFAATGATAPVAVPSGPTLRRQIKHLRARLTEIEGELHRIFGSRLYELFIAARQASRQGRDLLHEMAGQIDTSIAQLRQRCCAKTARAT